MLQPLDPGFQAFSLQVQPVDIGKRGFQLPAPRQASAFLMNVFFNIGVQGCKRLSAPANSPANALADGVDVVVLEPGESWAGTWTLTWTPAA